MQASTNSCGEACTHARMHKQLCHMHACLQKQLLRGWQAVMRCNCHLLHATYHSSATACKIAHTCIGCTRYVIKPHPQSSSQTNTYELSHVAAATSHACCKLRPVLHLVPIHRRGNTWHELVCSRQIGSTHNPQKDSNQTKHCAKQNTVITV